MNSIARHAPFILAIAALLIFGIAYPFLPGTYDSLAYTLSVMIQTGGAIGMLFVPVGVLWLLKPRAHVYAYAAVAIGVILAAVVLIIALFSVGASFALIVAAAAALAGWNIWPRLKSLKHGSAVPLYLIAIPVILVAAQFILATPLSELSRERAIANSAEFIGDIEAYREEYGRYPVSLLGQHKDYSTGVVGIEKYHYEPQGDAYNFFFENPKFAFDTLGTREWIVYNQKDEHRMYSHAAWHMLLTPEQQEQGQGWYASGDVGRPHWKYFLFD